MIRGRLGRFAAALAVCACLACVADSAQADIITYTAEIPGGSFQPTIPQQEYTLGTLGPQYFVGATGPMAIPAERIITGAKLLGTWEPVTGSTQNPPLSQILADGVPVAQIDPSATLPQPWSYDLAGDLEYLRSTGISMKLKVLGTGFIGVGPTRLEIQTVPEPGTVALWSLAGVTCLGVGLWRRRRRA